MTLISSEGKTKKQLKKEVKDAMKKYFKVSEQVKQVSNIVRGLKYRFKKGEKGISFSTTTNLLKPQKKP